MVGNGVARGHFVGVQALAATAQMVVNSKTFLHNFEVVVTGNVKLHCDNQAALVLATGEEAGARER